MANTLFKDNQQQQILVPLIVSLYIGLYFNLIFFIFTVFKKQRTDRRSDGGRLSVSSEDSRTSSPTYADERRLHDTASLSPLSPSKSSPTAEDLSIPYDRTGRLAETWFNSFTHNSPKKCHQPLDVLCRIFPHKKRTVLDLILRGCGGDTVQAIEQVLTTQTQEEKVANGLMYPSASTAPLATSHLQSSVLKSAFSPIPSFSAANTLNTMRYAWGGAAGRNLAMTMPYSHLFPGLSMGSTFSYSPLATQSDKLSPYSMYPFWAGKPFPSKEVEKTSGCISD